MTKTLFENYTFKPRSHFPGVSEFDPVDWFLSSEVNFMWAAHQAHHSSEEYNLSTALRQSVLQKYNSWVSILRIAIFLILCILWTQHLQQIDFPTLPNHYGFKTAHWHFSLHLYSTFNPMKCSHVTRNLGGRFNSLKPKYVSSCDFRTTVVGCVLIDFTTIRVTSHERYWNHRKLDCLFNGW